MTPSVAPPGPQGMTLDLLPLPAFLAGEDGALLEANAAARLLLEPCGTEGPDPLGAPVWLGPDDAALQPDRVPAFLAQGGAQSGATVFGRIGGSGEIRWFQPAASPLSQGTLVLLHDCTEHQDLARALASRARINEATLEGSLEDVLRITVDEAEHLTGSGIGFYHFVETDQETLSLQAWSTRTARDHCTAEGWGRHYPVSQAGVWVDALREGHPVIHNDYAALPHRRGLPPGHADILREAVVTVRRADKVVAILGVGNKPVPYTEQDLRRLQNLADLAWDITEHKRAKEGLHLRDRALEQSLAAFVMTDAEGRLRHVNPAFLAFWGYENPGQVLGRNRTEFWADAQAAARMTRLAKEAGEAWGDLHALRADGSTFMAEAKLSAVRDASGRLIAMLGTARDVTEQRRSQAAAEEQKAALEQFFQASADLLCVADTTGHFLKVNEAWGRLLGYPAEELAGVRFLDLVHPGDLDATLEALSRLAQGEPVIDFVNRYRAKDGSWHDLEWRSKARGSVIFAGARDITGRREAEAARRSLEEQLQHLHRLESIGRLAGGISHDMNNVLAAIQSVAEVLRLKGGDGTRQVELILDAARRGRDLLQGLTAFARKEVMDAEPVDLNALVRDEANLLSRTTLQRIRIDLDLDPELPPILGSASALSTALMNLCVNAMDAMPEGGALLLRTRRHGEAALELCVQDTGQGMLPEILARALEPFYTTKPLGKGTGLGLSMVYGTVQAHGGTLEIQSQAGQGTLVRITLPVLSGAPALRPGTRTPEAPEPCAGLRVLLVDDDPLIRESAPELLELLGCQVTVAEGGREALAALEQELPCDLVMLDLNMPDMDGLETLKGLRRLRPGLPVLMATGFADEEVRQRVARLGPSHVMGKPYTLQEVKEAMELLRPAGGQPS